VGKRGKLDSGEERRREAFVSYANTLQMVIPEALSGRRAAP
jgi:hypothetical protein